MNESIYNVYLVIHIVFNFFFFKSNIKSYDFVKDYINTAEKNVLLQTHCELYAHLQSQKEAISCSCNLQIAEVEWNAVWCIMFAQTENHC